MAGDRPRLHGLSIHPDLQHPLLRLPEIQDHRAGGLGGIVPGEAHGDPAPDRVRLIPGNREAHIVVGVRNRDLPEFRQLLRDSLHRLGGDGSGRSPQARSSTRRPPGGPPEGERGGATWMLDTTGTYGSMGPDGERTLRVRGSSPDRRGEGGGGGGRSPVWSALPVLQHRRRAAASGNGPPRAAPTLSPDVSPDSPRRNHRRHLPVGEDELQEILFPSYRCRIRPPREGGVPCPGWRRSGRGSPDPKGRFTRNRHPMVGGGRDQPLGGSQVVDGVVQLDEVQRVAGDGVLHLRVLGGGREGGDPHIAGEPPPPSHSSAISMCPSSCPMQELRNGRRLAWMSPRFQTCCRSSGPLSQPSERLLPTGPASPSGRRPLHRSGGSPAPPAPAAR